MIDIFKKHGDWALAGGSGVLLFAIFPPFGAWFLAWVALVPLLIAASKSDPKRAFYLGLSCGFVYFLGLVNWILALEPFSHWTLVLLGLALLAGYLCLYVALFALLLKFLIRGLNPFYPFIVAAIWTALEFIRSWLLTGFPWGSIGYSQAAYLPTVQMASVFGVLGVSYMVILINASLAYIFISNRSWKSKLKGTAIPFCLLTSSLIYGIIALNPSPESEKLKVAIVPGNIKQKDKWKQELVQKNFLKYLTATQRAAMRHPDVVVWPETAVPIDLITKNSYNQQLQELSRRYNLHLLIGIPHVERSIEGVKTYNTVFLMDPEGKVLDMYHKTHLVPFGEYIPFKRYLPEKLVDIMIGVADFDPGKKDTIFSIPPARFGVGICFESAFPGIFRKFAQNGANAIGILTNDSWFEGTAAPKQHYDMAIFRAVENRTAIFRAANGGISGAIDAYGRMVSDQIEPYNSEKEFLISELPLSSQGSFYTKRGDLLPYACLIATILLLSLRLRGGKRDDIRP